MKLQTVVKPKPKSSFNPKTLCVVDTETTGLHYFHGDRLFSVPLADQDGNTLYIDFPVDPFTREVLYKQNPKGLKLLREILEDPITEKPLFNTKFDQFHLEFGPNIKLAGTLHEVYFMARICKTNELGENGRPEGKGAYKLKKLSRDYLGVDNDDEVLLQKKVVAARRQATKLGWKIATEETHGRGYVGADYWVPKALDPESRECEIYALKDVMPRTLVLFLMYREIMQRSGNEGLWATYQKELKVYPIIRAMEKRGIGFRKEINDRELESFRSKAIRERQACKEIIETEGKIWYTPEQVKVMKRTGEVRIPEFNPGSDQHIARVLFSSEKEGGYGLPPVKLTDTGNPSTDWESLLPYAHIPFVRHLLHSKNAEKCVTSFFGNFNRFICSDPLVPGGHCLHANFNQMVSTARMSASDPPVQIIPNAETSARSYIPIQAREAFSPRPGYVFYKIDYSGQELRIFTHVAQIKELIEAYKRGEDVNAINADRVWGGENNILALKAGAEALELGDPTLPEQIRGISEEKASDREKQILGILSVWDDLGWNSALASGGMDRGEALDAAKRWLERFNWSIYMAEKSIGKKKTRTAAKNFIYMKIYGGGIKKCMEQLRCSERDARRVMDAFDDLYPGMQECMDNVQKLARTRGYIINDYGRRINVDPEKAYKGMNYWIQSDGADMMKQALIDVVKYIKSRLLDYHPVIVNHDELLLEVRQEQATKAHLRRICAIMVEAGSILSVPAAVEIQRCPISWNQGVEIKL